MVLIFSQWSGPSVSGSASGVTLLIHTMICLDEERVTRKVDKERWEVGQEQQKLDQEVEWLAK